jgi:hypothetical protein
VLRGWASMPIFELPLEELRQYQAQIRGRPISTSTGTEPLAELAATDPLS